MEKLLFMGCSFGTREALQYAKSIGIHTIVTDYNPPEISILKSAADEYWMIDVANVDELEEKCRKEKVTGIFAATSEFCLDKTKELCQRLELPFYAFDEGWVCARDKMRFKQHCMECGVDTPRTWLVGNELTKEVLDKIEYPVIVKPIDACAQRGISVCENEQELTEGFETALNKSESKEVMIEDYVVGTEVAPFYFFVNGEVILSELDDLVYLPINGRNNFVFVKNYSEFTKEYMDEIEPKMKKLFQHIGCDNGVAFLQGIRKNDRVYFLELGYRIDGIGAWARSKKACNYSSIEFMVDFSLGHPTMPDRSLYLEKRLQNKPGGTYLLWARPGKVARIEGVDAVKRMESVDLLINRFQIGDQVPQAVSMLQVAFGICLVVEDKSNIKEKVRKINEVLHMYDEEGNDLLYYLTDYDSLE